jgi:UDP-N-acetylglucosamine--N-acetylmuramyl-(pentapeptide) pyrophosphoryl-undecaprenol N-acetylglucosamine transferase
VPGPVVITGGGTGGHVFPMQAIAEALRERGVASSGLRYVGSRRGQEAQLLRGEIALTLLPGRGIRRSLLPRDVIINFGAAVGLVTAVVMALVLVRRWRPSVVVSVGGYASFAVSCAAVIWHAPLVLVEFDATPGAAHRLFQRYARKRCCAFQEEGDNVVVTGAPLRRAIEDVDRSNAARAAAKASFVPPIESDRDVVVVMTGSLGSTRVNRAVRELARTWADRSDRTLLHVTGRRDYDEFLGTSPMNAELDYRVSAFADMVELWAVADVAVCRSGAITVAELAVLAVPSVLVPLPGAPNDHQTKNALAVAAVGGARMVRDDECTGDRLAALLDEILVPARRASMEEGAHSLAHPHAADAIASVVIDARSAS